MNTDTYKILKLISGENIILTTPTTDIAMEFEAR